MIIYEDDTWEIIEDYLFSIGYSKDGTVIGFCFWDKYCWTNVFGFEKLH
jgi:hypothetical protein